MLLDSLDSRRVVRIFLSYGHDDYISLALRIKHDLEERGHEVWFDVERLKPGAIRTDRLITQMLARSTAFQDFNLHPVCYSAHLASLRALSIRRRCGIPIATKCAGESIWQ